MHRAKFVTWTLACSLAPACGGGSGNTGATTADATTTGETTANTTSSSEPTSTSSTPATTTGEPSPSTGEPSPTTSSTTEPDTTTGEPPNLQMSVSQYGITWTFDAPRQVGQFVTGDWWVVGPVTIVSVDPAPAEGRNGSMLDPVGSQDYDSRAGNHGDGLRVSFPLAVEGTHSLVSAISHPEEPECEQGGSDGWHTYDGDCQRGPIATQAILTVVPAPQPADAFRPPYAGADKPIHRTADICGTALPKLAAPGDTPDATALLRHVERPWIDHLRTWEIQHGCATLNMYCYGREVGDIVATLASYVLLDTPEQEPLAHRLVQLGIDNYGVLQAGGNWDANGGHSNGRKFPIVFAGALLGDAAMASPGTDIGNEDEMTYHGEGDKALWGRACNDCYFDNGCQYSGDCENGAKDCRDPAGLADGCSDYRNCCTSHTWVGEALAIHAMDLRAAWAHDPFFDYVDRWVAGDVEDGGGASNDFVAAMWTAYRDAAPTVSACP
ncbi:hypothetical protein [Nannocystis radixulma]|uniref:Uncharacterized protein n=1 Tax=Nannocystis radixulma TaxID=2995305 RepID=A0ABT5AY80_9BACT|nr:hypothetical protein [Nannocystis radixulma]MDC0666793.1 hypothetical protein [Nannocystis radixulma]